MAESELSLLLIFDFANVFLKIFLLEFGPIYEAMMKKNVVAYDTVIDSI